MKNNRQSDDVKDRRVADVQRFLLFALVLVLVIWGLFGLALGIMVAPNNDMYPRIDAGDLILAHEVAVYESDGKELIGRIIAASGDVVDINDEGEIFVNGNYTVERGIFYDTPKYEGGIDLPVTLGPDEYFILADSRQGGMDSRYLGPIAKDEIKGTVITVIRRNNI